MKLYSTIGGNFLGIVTHTEGGLHFYTRTDGKLGFWRVEVSELRV